MRTGRANGLGKNPRSFSRKFPSLNKYFSPYSEPPSGIWLRTHTPNPDDVMMRRDTSCVVGCCSVSESFMSRIITSTSCTLIRPTLHTLQHIQAHWHTHTHTHTQTSISLSHNVNVTLHGGIDLQCVHTTHCLPDFSHGLLKERTGNLPFVARVARFGFFEAKKWQIWPFLYRLAWTFCRIY